VNYLTTTACNKRDGLISGESLEMEFQMDINHFQTACSLQAISQAAAHLASSD
jgi:hypothetical protein